MISEASFIDLALRSWKANIDRAGTFFGALMSSSDWLQKHTAVSEEDFVWEPHRNRFAVLLARTAHLAYHLGQAVLAKRES
jgi:hypothetical protein